MILPPTAKKLLVDVMLVAFPTLGKFFPKNRVSYSPLILIDWPELVGLTYKSLQVDHLDTLTATNLYRLKSWLFDLPIASK
jgi:hypothetical protein